MRRSLVFLVLLAAGCAKKAEFGRESLPTMVEGGWQIAADAPVPPAEWPEGVHAKQALRAEYRGPQNYTATVYEFPAETSAFEMVQKWRPQQGTTAFQHKTLFVVVTRPNGAAEAQPFVKALDKSLP